MVETQIASRGIHDAGVLEAMGRVRREAFIPAHLSEFAYTDAPLPIEEEQTISQPYIVALMTAALQLSAGDRVLEIGTGSGYAAAVLAEIAGEVFTVERHEPLAESARQKLDALGYQSIQVQHADGTNGWLEHAPYDAIVVAAGGPAIPRPLRDQLAVGGRLVIPIGPTPRLQELVRVTRSSEDEYRRENLGSVRFVPLIGVRGWSDGGGELGLRVRPAASRPATVAELVQESCERIEDIQQVDLGSILERIGDARVVLLGEATHGTSEFYRMRARITRELIERRGFDIVAVEADWPDAAHIDHYVRHAASPPTEHRPFSRFPQWMWRNYEVLEFAEWLRDHNVRTEDPARQVGFYGLDLYSLYTSIDAVLDYLEKVDPAAARVARDRYGCLSPWEADPATYGRAALSREFRTCENEVVTMLRDMLGKRAEYAMLDGARFLDAIQNARLVANAEQYYRIMYYGSSDSWNLRDRHMFDTLKLLLTFRGPESKAVVWEHNSHIGDAAATEMGARGELNVGRLCRQEFQDRALLVGFGTDHGKVAAASDWNGPMEIKDVRPAHPDSYERLFHDSEIEAFVLHLREPVRAEIREELTPARLERAIGVIYRPETELRSHYFQAVLPEQFDEYVWFDESNAVRPLGKVEVSGLPDTYPFGL